MIDFSLGMLYAQSMELVSVTFLFSWDETSSDLFTRPALSIFVLLVFVYGDGYKEASGRDQSRQSLDMIS